MKKIDLNCDLGEGKGPDRALMPWITSANIACGAHAGDRETMRAVVREALRCGVAIGAHPGYDDPAHFGRRELMLEPDALKTLIRTQILALKEIVEEEGGHLHHVKLHGALYNQAAREPRMARLFMEVVREIDPQLHVFGMPSTAMHHQAIEAGLHFVSEGFADRAYAGPGRLAPRSMAGAVIHETQRVVDRAVSMVSTSMIRTLEGMDVPNRVQTLCVHGDTAGALGLLSALHDAFKKEGISILPHKAEVRFLLQGEQILLVRFGEQAHETMTRRVERLRQLLEDVPVPGVREMIPSQIELAVFYDPQLIGTIALVSRLASLVGDIGEGMARQGGIVEIPVCYDPSFGPDLALLEERLGRPVEEIIERHTASEGRVTMMGFKPGFAYISGLDPLIDQPRLKTPRTRIPAGSVAIANGLTGIYPVEGPGGWLLIGRTPLTVFDPEREAPFLLSPGDAVRFHRIDRTTFDRMVQERKPRSEPDDKEAAFIVEHPGILTLIEDGGRSGYLAHGVTPSGPMDAEAMGIANRLVGNPEEAPALEWTGWGPTLQFRQARVVALTGGDFDARLNGGAMPRYQNTRVHPGDVLTMGPCRQGFRGYLAISGGIENKRVLGSCAMDLSTGLGGTPLKKGQRLSARPLSFEDWRQAPELIPGETGPVVTLRFLEGPEFGRLSPDGRRAMRKGVFTIGNSSDRMGYRLEGEPLELVGDADILSSAVSFGTVQLPGDGHPIIMMAEHQTTGGYARIAQVIRADLGLLAQCRPGEKVRFEQVTLDAALQCHTERQRQVEYLTERVFRRYVLRVNGREYDVRLEDTDER